MVLVVADAGIDQDVLRPGADHIALHAKGHEAADRVQALGLHPGAMRIHHFLGQFRQEFRRIEHGKFLFDNAVDANVADMIGQHGAFSSFCRVGTSLTMA